ncbi:hypothetical protein FBULB1_11976 [Fusarium bulbicola]|nr:hypothetical protein FBULB1_11976 [Fusarium bulbicola]
MTSSKTTPQSPSHQSGTVTEYNDRIRDWLLDPGLNIQVPTRDLLDEYLTRTLKDNADSSQAASLDGMVLRRGKLSRRPDTPIPITRNPASRAGSLLNALRLPPNITNNPLQIEEEKQSPLFQARSTTPNKKRRASGFAEDLYDVDEDGYQSPNEGVKRFACPYFRKNPERHLACINLKMVRISDVKQHLKRRHMAPYPCPRCSEGFLSLNLQEEHILQQSCSPGSGANWDSVSLASQRSLQARFAKGLSPEAQWYGIWKILFGAPRGTMPRPHLDGVVKEVIGILRGIWLDEGRQLISEFVQASDQPPDYTDELYKLLTQLLDEVEARFEQKPAEKVSSKTCMVSEVSLEESAGVQLDTISNYITEGPDSQPLVAPFDTTPLSLDFSAAQSEVSEMSYQTSELSFPGAQLLQTQFPYTDNAISDFDLWDYNLQQTTSMDGAKFFSEPSASALVAYMVKDPKPKHRTFAIRDPACISPLEPHHGESLAKHGNSLDPQDSASRQLAVNDMPLHDIRRLMKRDPDGHGISALGYNGVLRTFDAKRNVLDAVDLGPEQVREYYDGLPIPERFLTADGRSLSVKDMFYPNPEDIPRKHTEEDRAKTRAYNEALKDGGVSCCVPGKSSDDAEPHPV